MTYTYKEAYKTCLDYFNGDDLAAKAVVDKYLLRDKDNNLVEKSPEEKHRRIAKELYRIEKNKFDGRKKEITSDDEFEKDWNRPLAEEYIFSLLDRYKFIVPQGSIMAGLGDEYRYVSLSNCFVVPSPYDSYAGILKTDEHIVQISKRRGGIGYDGSTLRPEGLIVNNCARTTSGAVSFFERFSNTGREVGQNNRRAAQMITLSVHHPDINKFVNVKRDLSKITGANISVRLSDEFLNAVQDEQQFELRWPEQGKKQISLYTSAKELWNQIISAARDMAEPGLLFWDNIIRESPADCYWRDGFRTVCTNPCSELPLSEFDSCRLLVLNLFSYIINPYTADARLDRKRLYIHAQIAQRFMDHIVDLELECIDKIISKIQRDPEPEEIKATELSLWNNVRNACAKGRRTGTGITGLGDALAALDIRYGSDQSVEQSEEIYKIIKFGCYRSSVNMAQELGAFEVWDHEREKDCAFLKRIKEEVVSIGPDSIYGSTLISGFDLWSDMKKYGRRNISLLTIAPTGTLSILTQTTSGVEPVFMLSYTRRKKINHDDKNSKVDFIDNIGDKWQEFEVVHKGLELWKKATNQTDYAASPYFNACAEEINWENRVKLQAAIQRHCDHSISSTINLPEDVTTDEVRKIYETAWKSGCKGITVYRKNSRSGVLVEKKDVIAKTTAPKRPDSLPCNIHHIHVKGEPYFVAVGLLDNEPYEVFAGRNNCIDDKVKGGILIKSKRPKGYKAELDDGVVISPITMACTDNEETVTRLISMSLRHGASINFVAEQLGKTNGEMTSYSKAIARVLKKYIKDGTKSNEKCSECGAQLIFEAGCTSCKQCGFSKCS
jgi:ribonucleoside-diphosphate reductase alpha chain